MPQMTSFSLFLGGHREMDLRKSASVSLLSADMN